MRSTRSIFNTTHDLLCARCPCAPNVLVVPHSKLSLSSHPTSSQHKITEAELAKLPIEEALTGEGLDKLEAMVCYHVDLGARSRSSTMLWGLAP